MPLVSVIMPAHDASATLDVAVQSVLDQTLTDWELLVTDDNSTDDTWQRLQRLAASDNRIRPARMRSDGAGAAAARNEAMERAEGDYIAFLDSDDLWLPEKLERQLAFAAEVDTPLTFTSYFKVHPEFGGHAIDFLPSKRIVRARPTLTYATMLRANYIGCLTAMYDRRRLGTRLMPPLRKRQDYALWLSILQEGVVAHGLDEPLALYRDSRPGSLSGNKLSLIRYNWELYRRVARLSVPRSATALVQAAAHSMRKRWI